jgi:hypothetical protein
VFGRIQSYGLNYWEFVSKMSRAFLGVLPATFLSTRSLAISLVRQLIVWFFWCCLDFLVFCFRV